MAELKTIIDGLIGIAERNVEKINMLVDLIHLQVEKINKLEKRVEVLENESKN